MDTLTPAAWADSLQAKKPKATDDFSSGMYRMEKRQALTKKHIGMNSDWATGAITFDIDHDDAADLVKSLAWDDEAIPAPSWITTNKGTGHAHIGYLLEKPILTTRNSHYKPVAYLADIERTITNRIPGADRGYTGSSTRNPLNTAWHEASWGPAKPYTLQELHEPLGKLDKPSKVVTEVGLGRNCSLFNALRTWAYSQFCKHDTMETFEKAIWAQARAMNAVSFEAPLTNGEVSSIARSVSNWTWKKFHADAPRFSETQRFRAMQRTAYTEKQAALAMIREDAENGIVPSAKEVMERFGVSRPTAYNYLRELGLTESRSIDDRIPEVMALKAQRFSNVVIADKMGLSRDQVQRLLKKGREAVN